MPVLYVETSALTKHYRRESGSEAVNLLFAGTSFEHRLAVSFLSLVEFAGLVTRLRRGAALGENEAFGIMSRFSNDCLTLDIVPLTNSTLEAALEIAANHGLKALDSIHLATMAELRRASLMAGATFAAVSADKELCAAAKLEGIDTLNPEDQGALERLREMRSGT